jgi:hypothetical protein
LKSPEVGTDSQSESCARPGSTDESSAVDASSAAKRPDERRPEPKDATLRRIATSTMILRRGPRNHFTRTMSVPRTLCCRTAGRQTTRPIADCYEIHREAPLFGEIVSKA